MKSMTPKVKALLAQLKSGKLNYVKTHPYATLPEIEKKLGMIHQTASARVSDLQDMGLIEDRGERKHGKSSYSYFKFQPDLKKQSINAEARKKEKYQAWVKKGLTHFKELINPDLKHELLCTK